MTCIAGVVGRDGQLYMGADSAGVSNYMVHIRSDRKVFVRQKMIFGFTSSFRMGQLIQYRLKIPDHPKRMSDHEYLSTRFVDAIRYCFKEGGYCKKEHDREEGGVFLLGYRKHLYHIDSDFQVGLRDDGIDSVGSGGEVAMGSLFTSRALNISAPDSIRIALEAASHLNAGVRPPFTILRLPNK